MQVLRFVNLKWPEGHPEDAAFQCIDRGCRIDARDKAGMLAAGEWRAEAPEHFRLPSGRGYASFHVWAAYSSSPNAQWGQLAAEYVKAVHGGPTTHQTFVNTVLGESWREAGEAPPWEPLLKRREPYRIGTCPRGVLLLVAGVDVQKDRLVYEVVGYGRGRVSWSVDYGTIPGNTDDLTAAGPWTALDRLLARGFPAESGAELTIERLAVDSGYNASTVYQWARQYPLSRVLAIKGLPGGGPSILGDRTIVDVTVRGRKVKGGASVWGVRVSLAKSELYGWLRLEDPEAPGFCHFPEYGEDYFRELTAEQLLPIVSRRGYLRMEWALIPGRQNHALDARVYARAAAILANLDRMTPSDWRAREAALGPVTAAADYDDERPE